MLRNQSLDDLLAVPAKVVLEGEAECQYLPGLALTELFDYTWQEARILLGDGVN